MKESLPYPCLACYRISPGDAAFCAFCGRTFGARLCGAKRPHRSPAGVGNCVQCGSTKLTQPTRFLSLGCLSRLLALAVVMLVARLIVAHGGVLKGVCATGVLWTMAHVLGADPRSVEQVLECVIAWSVLLMLPLLLLPRDASQLLLRLYGRVLRVVWHLAGKGMRMASAVLSSAWRRL